MFKSRDQIEVIKVKSVTRDVEEKHEDISEYHYGRGNSSRVTTTTKKKCDFTQVLLIKNGELYTREFNGAWDLEDVKKWEDV